jgi:hypothetical protein
MDLRRRWLIPSGIIFLSKKIGTFCVVPHLIPVGRFLISTNRTKKENTMKNISQSPFTCLTTATPRILLGLMLAFGTATFVHAQGQVASGTISSAGSGPYTYSLTFSDAAGATSPIGSVWYSWVPGLFFLPGDPTSASAPAGWTATIFNNSVQFVANSPANAITAGQSLSGFGYQATFSPAQLAAMANSGESDAYSGALFSDGGNIFVVQAVPEPSGQMLLLASVPILWLIRRKLRTA